jgi:hypothetical protein
MSNVHATGLIAPNFFLGVHHNHPLLGAWGELCFESGQQTFGHGAIN